VDSTHFALFSGTFLQALLPSARRLSLRWRKCGSGVAAFYRVHLVDISAAGSFATAHDHLVLFVLSSMPSLLYTSWRMSISYLP
jgi:hypothetical protein